MSVGICHKCEEFRSDDGSDLWGFIWHAALPRCQRCGGVIELTQEAEDNGVELFDETGVIDES